MINTEGVVVIGRGPCQIERIRLAGGGAEDWAAATAANTSMADAVRRLRGSGDGEVWALTVCRDAVTDDELDADPSVYAYAEIGGAS